MILGEIQGREGLVGYWFYCPACRERHVFYTSGRVAWSFNGNQDSPSFTPSLLNTWTNHDEGIAERCHLFLTDGVIHYCGDCTHSMAGQSVPATDCLTNALG